VTITRSCSGLTYTVFGPAPRWEKAPFTSEVRQQFMNPYPCWTGVGVKAIENHSADRIHHQVTRLPELVVPGDRRVVLRFEEQKYFEGIAGRAGRETITPSVGAFQSHDGGEVIADRIVEYLLRPASHARPTVVDIKLLVTLNVGSTRRTSPTPQRFTRC